jgi:hypothetical protein
VPGGARRHQRLGELQGVRAAPPGAALIALGASSPYDRAVPFTLRDIKKDLEDIGSLFGGALRVTVELPAAPPHMGR